MNTQPELDFSTPPTRAQELSGRLQELVKVLQEASRWMTRRELEVVGFEERELRELCQHDTEGLIFSYPGSPGYKAFDLVTDVEFDRCGALKNQAKEMARRWVRYSRRWHKRFKGRIEGE